MAGVDAPDELRGLEGVAAEIEEIVVRADLVESKDFGPKLRQLGFHG